MKEKEFLTKLFHDLKNPITAIKLLSNILLDGKAGTLTEKQKSIVVSIQEANEKLILVLEKAKKT